MLLYTESNTEVIVKSEIAAASPEFEVGRAIKDFKSTGEVCLAPDELRTSGIRNNREKEEL